MKISELLQKYNKSGQFDTDSITPLSVSYDGDTPLHIASFNNAIDDLSIMLNEIDLSYINIAGDIGNTPLHCAVSNSSIDCIKLLLKYGANPKAENEYGDSCLDWAENEPTVLNILQKYV